MTPTHLRGHGISLDQNVDGIIVIIVSSVAVGAGDLNTSTREIEAIVKERGSNMSFRLKTVPPEFFPFIAGAHGAYQAQPRTGPGQGWLPEEGAGSTKYHSAEH
jgi:hypothetical protein